ncbi:MAG: alcohol dehydrogenase catalytic domain-containing protein [Fuerstiella sp.]
MNCLYLSDGTISYRTHYQSQPTGEGLIPIDVQLAGICETDLQLQQGYMNFEGVLGHEFVGIAAAGKFSGQRVVGEINCSCGRCSECSNNRSRHCTARTVVGILNHDGAFADRVWVPEENLHAVPDSVSDQQAVFTEPLAAACRIPEQVRIKPSDQVVVLGDGRLGHLSAAVLALTSQHVTVVGKHQWKLDMLKPLSVSTCLLQDDLPSKTADVVVDCTGSESGFELALKAVRPCGTVVLKTTVANNHQLALSAVVIDEVNIVGSRCGPFQPALQMLERKEVDVERLVSASYPLTDGIAAFQHAQQPDALKVLLEIGSLK